MARVDEPGARRLVGLGRHARAVRDARGLPRLAGVGDRQYYLEDEELARQLVELGYRGSGDTLKRDEFEARKRALRERGTQKANVPKQLASANKDLSQFPFLLALANREELVRNGKLTTIVFLRDRNGKGQEVSGYIDYAHRLKTENFEPYFDGRKKLMPKPTDLSYYNWETQTSTSNSTPNFRSSRTTRRGCCSRTSATAR